MLLGIEESCKVSRSKSVPSCGCVVFERTVEVRRTHDVEKVHVVARHDFEAKIIDLV